MRKYVFDSGQLFEIGVFDVVFNMLVSPSGMIRYVVAVPTNVQYWQNIGFERITNHQKLTGVNIKVFKQLLVVCFFFLTHDFDMVEVMF